MYQALYRKYRSKNFDDVVGQEHITQTLKNEIAQGRVGHAYLFTGSRGTGKTSCSKIIAKAVNCPNQTGGNPCGVCEICRGIDDGSILDVTEIDAASNNGVDNIRQLREEANFTPTVASYRVYIIDEAHMLSTGAFNALLKIMEEPPEHVIFILATTEVHKVPATIQSRCQRFDFGRIRTEKIAAHLLRVSAQEGIALEEGAATLIARLAEGGMRDALSLLDVCRGKGEITVEVVSQAAGLAMQDCLFELGDAVLGRDIPRIVATIDRMHDASIDFEKMCVQLIAHYRGLMMARAVADPERFVLGTQEDLQRLREQAAQYTMPYLLYCLSTLQDTLSRMGRTSQTRTELEMAMIRLTHPALDASMDAIQARISRLEEALRRGIGPALPGGEAAKPVGSAAPPAPQGEKKSAPPAPAESAASPRAADPSPEELTQVERFEPWPQVLEQLKHSNNALKGALMDAAAYQHNGFVLIDCQDPFFLELIRTNEYAKQSLHQALIQATGRDYRIGPYRKDKHRPAGAAEEDPMEDILGRAMEQGVEVRLDGQG